MTQKKVREEEEAEAQAPAGTDGRLPQKWLDAIRERDQCISWRVVDYKVCIGDYVLVRIGRDTVMGRVKEVGRGYMVIVGREGETLVNVGKAYMVQVLARG